MRSRLISAYRMPHVLVILPKGDGGGGGSTLTSPNIIRVVKSRRMRWAGHVARMGDMKNAQKLFGRKN